jgi:sulfoquinovosidase
MHSNMQLCMFGAGVPGSGWTSGPKVGPVDASRNPALRVAATLSALAVVVAACTDSGDDAADDGADGTGPAAIALTTEVGDDARLTVRSGDRDLLVSADDGAVAWRTAEQAAAPKGGAYLGHELLTSEPESEAPWTDATAATVTGDGDGDGDTVRATLTAGQHGDGEATLSAEPAGDGITRITVTAPEGANEVSVSFACGDDERFYGFGAQTWATQHRGETIPIWVVEQGLGKVTPETPEPVPSLLGEPYDSYLPMPWFASSAGYGISLDTTRYSTFELCTAEHPDRWTITTWDDELSWFVIGGDTPRDLLVRYTGLVGRPLREPPDWFYAPMNDAVRGRANVERVARVLRDNDIASSVIWTEDWIGLGSAATGLRLSHDWDVSPDDYPDLRSMTDALHDDGFRFLGYVSPFIPDAAATPGGTATLPSGQEVTLFPQNDVKWPEAIEGGFTITDEGGEPYRMLSPPFVSPPGSALDVTNDEAVAWFQGWIERAEALGLDGSMTDFGEWVPVDARFADGRTGAEVHNEYPLLWQQANRDVWERLRPDGDYLFYVRSGFTGTARLAPAVWGGDQNTTFDRLDGLGSVITMGVNLGLSGIGYYGHDIAGYSAFALPGIENTPTTEELFLRWAAIGAYTPMMRTHHGSRYGENWSFEGAPNPANPVEPIQDPETLATWKRLADEHIQLFPYLKAYGAEYAETGLPIMRHLWLTYPDDPVVWRGLPDDPRFDAFAAVGRPERELFQYLLGDQLLVAPIIDEGATSRPVYLPAGRWYDLRTGEAFVGPTVVEATAAPGEIPVFAPAGALVPRLPSGVETLVPTDDPEVVDVSDVADRMVVDVFLGTDGSFALTDGTRLELTSGEVPGRDAGGDVAGGRDGDGEVAVTVTVDGEAIPPAAGDPGDPPVGATVVVLPEGDDVTAEITVGGTTHRLTITDAPTARAYTLRIRA